MTDAQQDDGTNACVTCATRGDETKLKEGLVCDKCRGRIGRNLSDILRLCDRAAEHVQPGRGSSGGGRGVFESRPPAVLEAIDPELAAVTVFHGEHKRGSLLELLESWERLIRQERGFAAYGLASDLRQSLRQPVMPSDATPDGRTDLDRWFQAKDIHRSVRVPSLGQVTLTGVVTFLRSQVDWMCDTPDFPIADFANEIHAAWSTVRHWGSDGEPAGTIVLCPTLVDGNDNGICGEKLRVSILTEIEGRDDHRRPVWCQTCGAVRKPDQLLAASGADDAYLSAAMIAEYLPVAEGTIRTWAKAGKVKRDGRLFRLGDVKEQVTARNLKRQAGRIA
ncbi:MAG: hypothetical protein PSX37_08660 [bacterium]|nr:hypothetical protein [bacterium]